MAADKKELRRQYEARHPDMGICLWECGDRRWYSVANDTKAEENRTTFQLRLGSWPNREMQALYTKDPEAFRFSVWKTIEYEELTDDHTDDLELLRLEFLEEHPEALPMRPGRK